MGTKMAPSYANIFMGKLERQIIESSIDKPLSWFRFIDDIDMKWIKSEKDLKIFITHANNSILPSNLHMKFQNLRSPSWILPAPFQEGPSSLIFIPNQQTNTNTCHPRAVILLLVRRAFHTAKPYVSEGSAQTTSQQNDNLVPLKVI